MHKANWNRVAGRAALAVGVIAIGAAAGPGCSSRGGVYRPVYATDPYNATTNPNGVAGNPAYGAPYGQPGGPGYAPGYGAPGVAPGYVPPGAGGPPPAGGASIVPPGVTGNVATMLQAADRVLRAQNYQPIAMQQRNFGPGEVSSFQIGTQPGACYTVFALGGQGANDVDLTIVAPSGQTVQQDTNTDPHPNATFCPQEYGAHIARVTMFSGSGSVVFGAYQGPPNTQGNVAVAFEGGAPRPVATAPTQADPATAGRIEAMRAQLAASGYRPAGPLVGLPMAERGEGTFPVPLTAGVCYAFATLGGPGVRDSDIFVIDGLNRRIAADASTNIDALVQDVCPATSGTYYLHPRCFAGAGTVWFLPMARTGASGPNANPTETNPTTQAPVSIAAIPTSSSGGGLVPNFRRVERNLVQRGWAVEPNAAVTGTIGNGAPPPQHPIQLLANQCYAITALGDTGVPSLDLVLTDAQNHEVDRDRTQSSQPIVRVCPTATGTYMARLTTPNGGGQYRLGVMHWAGGTSGAGLAGLLFVRNAELTRILQADNYQADTDFDIVRARIRTGASERRNVNLRAGSCYAMVAVGDASVGDLDLAVHNGHTQVAVDQTHSASPEVRFCAQTAGRYEVAIHAAVGGGEYVFRVFKRQVAPGA